MNQFIFPALLVALAVGVFSVYINPTYLEVIEVTEDIARYDDALDRSKELLAIREELVSRYNSLSKENLEKLLKMLPANVDNVRLILDIDTLAASYGMRLTSLSIADTKVVSRVGTAIGPSDEKHQSVDIGFSTVSTYPNFRKFLRALETSLRIVDLKSLTFGATETGQSSDSETYQFQLVMSTYWLK